MSNKDDRVEEKEELTSDDSTSFKNPAQDVIDLISAAFEPGTSFLLAQEYIEEPCNLGTSSVLAHHLSREDILSFLRQGLVAVVPTHFDQINILVETVGQVRSPMEDVESLIHSVAQMQTFLSGLTSSLELSQLGHQHLGFEIVAGQKDAEEAILDTLRSTSASLDIHFPLDSSFLALSEYSDPLDALMMNQELEPGGFFPVVTPSLDHLHSEIDHMIKFSEDYFDNVFGDFLSETINQRLDQMLAFSAQMEELDRQEEEAASFVLEVAQDGCIIFTILWELPYSAIRELMAIIQNAQSPQERDALLLECCEEFLEDVIDKTLSRISKLDLEESRKKEERIVMVRLIMSAFKRGEYGLIPANIFSQVDGLFQSLWKVLSSFSTVQKISPFNIYSKSGLEAFGEVPEQLPVMSNQLMYPRFKASNREAVLKVTSLFSKQSFHYDPQKSTMRESLIALRHRAMHCGTEINKKEVAVITLMYLAAVVSVVSEFDKALEKSPVR